MNNKWKNGLMLLVVVLLCVLPLLFVEGEFGGADDAAEGAVTEIDPAYEPWFKPLTELPGETESMLFALQAALGAGVIGYSLGLLKGKHGLQKQKTPSDQTN
ncbi:energy-coupling factor ABC transporter substrate-binding protein [Paenibacillus sp. MMS20-IR301]|uniref:energy-coupling factor ABC transporter substrate-binding protein n=1 Tax=Paenibacillus sp. MMS20-IR301 TaxID=2895946 RepID=UPI0028E91C6E|nr:energy-coupling factor ABC transporter substrate-binding protein [Paenibacillus sp. MMS20-IR301]WNS46559.1 energy-coupling factor ABC transporter substrate-binding protein [Paenibacillus sp. MMS20-IR301]